MFLFLMLCTPVPLSVLFIGFIMKGNRKAAALVAAGAALSLAIAVAWAALMPEPPPGSEPQPPFWGRLLITATITLIVADIISIIGLPALFSRRSTK